VVISQGILRKNVVLAVAVCFALLAPPVSAQPTETVEIETVSTVDADNRTEVSVRYDTAVTVKINTYLFGSEELQERIVESIGVDEERVEFRSLNTDSAEMVYDGESDDVALPS
jgi:hypothetical protein